jgi:hypothetical protein
LLVESFEVCLLALSICDCFVEVVADVAPKGRVLSASEYRRK